MSDAIADRVRRYILDGGDADLQRLMGVSEAFAEPARRAFTRAGVTEGWTVIDCGCGPMGAIAVLAEMVGPTGRVVGVDFSEAAISRARSIADALGLENVDLHSGDIHELDPAILGAPFDLAFCRLFLMHQPDPTRTLRHLARLLRPGGLIVAHEALQNPPPRSYPYLESLAAYWALIHQLIAAAGGEPEAVEHLPQAALAAGLEIEEFSGFFTSLGSEVGFDLHAASMAAARVRAEGTGVPVERIDEIVSSLLAAKSDSYDWVLSPFFFDLRLRKPAADSPAVTLP
jgi:ubiquinone/menaquinone biosynthesis C-methylase UbiE